MGDDMVRFFKMQELFFNSTDREIKNLISLILGNLNCCTIEEDNKLLLYGLPTEEDIEESIDSLILKSENMMEMKTNLSIIKKFNLLYLREEAALVNRLIYEIGFSEEIDASISLEDAISDEEKMSEN